MPLDLDEKGYWDDRYEVKREFSGRSEEEVGKRNELLWEAIERELPEINHIIDVGCGDLRIWGDRDCEDYVGIDFALDVLQENKDIRRPHWTFLYADAAYHIPEIVRENVFCFNMIYHIMDPEKLLRVLRNLCKYASKRIFIYTWIGNPFHPNTSDGEYQMYHPMGRYIEVFRQSGFDLTSVEVVDDPLRLQRGEVRFALYIYKKQRMSPLEIFARR
jgi:SAM-dependent methyltransferase